MTPTPSPDEILTVEQVAELLQLHPNTVYRRVEDKSIPGAFRIGDEDTAPIRFSKKVVMEWIQKEATRP